MIYEAKILFCNGNGIDVAKFKAIIDLLDSFTYDIVIFQEHWFVRGFPWQTDSYLTHISTRPSTAPVIIGSNNLNPHIRRNDGGLAIFIHPSKQHLFKVLYTTQYSLSFNFQNLVYNTCYFPPSMPSETIRDELHKLPKPHLFIGDFNFRMGPLNNDTAITKATRHYLISQFSTKWELEWKKPHFDTVTRRNSGNDHCYLAKFITGRIDVIGNSEVGITSDHRPLKLQIQYDSENLAEMNQVTMIGQTQTRIYIRRLRDEKIKKKYIAKVEEKMNVVGLQDQMQKFWTSCFTKIYSRETVRVMLDTFNEQLTHLIWDAGKEVCGHYEVNRVKLSIDNLMMNLDNAHCNSEATMMFKRLNRGKHVRVLASRPDLDVHEEAQEFFSNLWNEEDPIDLINEISLETPFLHQTNAITPITQSPSFEPFPPITIKATIMKYPNSRSAGIDTIHIVMLKALSSSPSFMQSLHFLFSMCLQLSVTPIGWNNGRTTLITKKEQNPTPQSTRPISVTPIFRRIFECCLLKSWEYNAEAFIRLHPNQGGSRRGYSSFSHAVVNHELSHMQRDWTILLDIKKGFDSVRHIDLLKALVSKRVATKDLSLLSSLFFEKMETQLVVNGRCLSPIKVTKGIFQGSVLSPLLFEIWIDELCQLVNSFEQSDSLPLALFYVDDIVIKAQSREQAQSLLNICEKWLTSKRAKFNLTKSYLLRVKNDLMPQYVENPLTMYNELLLVVDEEEYLGVPTSRSGAKWNKLLSKQVDEARKVLNLFKVVGEGWPEWIRLILVKTFCLSKFNYCAPCTKIWLDVNNGMKASESLKKDIELLDKDLIMFIFQTTLNRPISVMRDMVQLDPILHQLGTMRSMVIEQVQRLSADNPWHKVKAKQALGSHLRQDHYLLKLHHSSEGAREYQRRVTTAAEQGRVSMKTFFKLQKYYRLHYGGGSKLEHYILAKSRKDIWMPEKLIYYKDCLSRKMMIDWRRNLLFTGRSCLVCSGDFNRRHLIDCEYQLIAPLTFYNENLHRQWFEETEYLEQDNEIHGWCKPSDRIIYTIIDSLINNASFELAYHWLLWLESNLPKKPHSIRPRTT